MTTCKHADSGCNYPEGDCAGVCMASAPWIQFDPLTHSYKSKDGTHVAAELVDNAQSMVDVLHIASIRDLQRSNIATRSASHG